MPVEILPLPHGVLVKTSIKSTKHDYLAACRIISHRQIRAWRRRSSRGKVNPTCGTRTSGGRARDNPCDNAAPDAGEKPAPCTSPVALLYGVSAKIPGSPERKMTKLILLHRAGLKLLNRRAVKSIIKKRTATERVSDKKAAR